MSETRSMLGARIRFTCAPYFCLFACVLALVASTAHASLDRDGDHDVDCDDVAAFADCMGGPGVAAWDPQCPSYDLDAAGSIDLLDFASLQLRFDTCGAPPGFTPISTPDELFAIRSNPNGDYFLCKDIDLAGYDVRPVCSCSVEFAGVFEGNEKTISNLSIIRRTSDCVGLFGANSGVIRNLRVAGATVEGDEAVGVIVGRNKATGRIENVVVDYSLVTGVDTAGGLVGENRGLILTSTFDGVVSGRRGWYGFGAHFGGAVGVNDGTIDQTSTTGAVSGQAMVGGLCGDSGTGGRGAVVVQCVSESYVSGKFEVGGLIGHNAAGSCVLLSYALGDVSGGDSPVGGLSGFNAGLIHQCYAQGDVWGGICARVGGLLGANGGGVEECYATGEVSGGTGVGGAHGGLVGVELVGPPFAPYVLASYWDTVTTLQPTSAGGTGLPTFRMQSLSAYLPVWDITYLGSPLHAAWRLRAPEKTDYPRLDWEFPPS